MMSIEPVSISLPKGGGAIKSIGETFQPTLFSGAASYSIPVPLTPSRGAEPKLSIDYSSGGGNDPMGLGFSLSLPKIVRKTDTGIPTYTEKDTFILSADGELVPKMTKQNGQWVPDVVVKNEDGTAWSVATFLPRNLSSFSLIELWKDSTSGNAWWKVTDRQNTIHIYGKNPAARTADPDNEIHIFEWLIESSTDSKGNKTRYQYKAEDGKNIAREIYEINRQFYAKNYIQSIQYGNYISANPQGGETFAFEVVFDYGEYALEDLNKPGSDPYTPVREWAERLDPFSSYRSGFEIRTFRLCRNLLLFHNFKELGSDPCLVKSMQMSHDETSLFSFLTAITQHGYRRNDDGSYAIKSLPAMAFQYSRFSPPTCPTFQPLTIDKLQRIPGYLDQSSFYSIDLKGEGLPGLLFSNNACTYYFEPDGNGNYHSPHVPDTFPVIKNMQDKAISFQSLDGNGQMELVVNSPNLSGFYSQGDDDGSWSPFTHFDSLPVDVSNPLCSNIDLDGNGQADLVLLKEPDLLCYPSKGKQGYGNPTSSALPDGFPVAISNGETELVTFANVFGDGLSHRLRIGNGSVEAWPNCGYGKFGQRVFLGNAPSFDPTTTVSRIYLADIDGTGTSDLVFAYPDRVEIFLNQSGNSFSTSPIKIPLPGGLTELDKIQFSDILGQGTTSLIFTKAGSVMTQWYYNFCGVKEDTTLALKPYLLTTIDTNLGSVTDFYYASSTQFYLADKKAGRPWATRLPFPVQVVEKTVVSDALSGSRLTSEYQYHEGYFDPVERQFRGFGFVESWDSESLEDYQQSTSNPDFPVKQINAELYVPPVYTKTWHHTGAFFDNGIITRQYEQSYFQGDAAAYDFPDSVMDSAVFASDPDTIRQGYAALAGSVMRKEVYSIDNSPLQSIPYSVTESNVEVLLVQPKANQTYAVFQVIPRESITYHYERDQTDPRVQQEFTLEVDLLCGEVKKACTVYLPRRSTSKVTYPEQLQLTATATCKDYINTTDSNSVTYRYLGVPYQTQEFNITGLNLNGKSYFSFDDVTGVINAVKNPIPYHAAVPSGLQAQQMSWDTFYFWNDDQTAPLALGQIASRALAHHNESAVFTNDFVTSVIGSTITDDTLQNQGGYFYDESTGYWWNKGLTQFYFSDPAAFYLPNQTANSFVTATSPLYSKSTVEYDLPYYFSAIKTSHYVDEAKSVVNTVSAQIDYITLQPFQTIDINGNVSQALFDPLGKVIASTLFGVENGNPKGGMRLYPYNSEPAEYVIASDADFDHVLQNPEKYLQGATGYFYYSFNDWKEKNQPPCAISLLRGDFYHDGQNQTAFSYKASVEYADGLGRVLENKLKTDTSWAVSGRTIYNNKGKPCEQYLPFFSDTPYFEVQNVIAVPPTVTHYDPLLRVIRTDTPKGFFSKVEFSPWEEIHFDENDTVIESDYYITFFQTYPANPTQAQIDEKDALQKAALFYNTPSIQVMDNAGHVVRKIQNNYGNVSPNDFQDMVKGSAITSEQLFNELVSQGYLVTNTHIPVGTWVTNQFQPYFPDFKLNLSAPFAPFAPAIITLLKQNNLTTFIANDSSGRELESIDPRLYYSNQTTGTSYFNFKTSYAMGAKEALQINGTDAGNQIHLSNCFGKPFWSLSARNYCQLTHYDALQRRTAVLVKKLDNDQPVTSYADFNCVEIFEYGETQPNPELHNLRGELYQLHDLSGILTNTSYSLLGELLETSRQMAVEYHVAINWNATPLPVLEQAIYTCQFSYNALSQLISETTPDGSVTTNSYNQAGLLNQILATFSGTSQTIVSNIDYDAKSQRTFIHYGNGIVTNYTYEPTTLYLTNLTSTRPSGNGVETIQDMRYTYDPVGNITRSWNNTFKAVFNNNQQVNPLSDYAYDAIYRLTQANGRQHPGINADTYKNNSGSNDFKQSIFNQLPDTNEADKLENYNEIYSYDDSGNLVKKQHIAASATWTSDNPVNNDSNHLSGLSYDASGNQCQLVINNPVALTFNCCENLVRAAIIERPGELDDCDYYVYDSNGLRTRKVSERMASGGAVTLIEEKIYFGNYEIKRNKSVTSGVETVTLERQTLRVMSGTTCIAIRNVCTIGTEPGRNIRFQMNDNLGSIACEYDVAAQLISYEEYFPYGGTAIIAGSNQAEVKLKDYRYSGKECDDSTGLYYYGARYYVTWLGRWLRPDPAGTVDGLNLYAFVGGNPIKNVDMTGMALTNPLNIAMHPAAMAAPHPMFVGAAHQVHFGMNSYGGGTGNNPNFYGFRDQHVTAGTGIMAETSWQHIMGPNGAALYRTTQPPRGILQIVATATVTTAAVGAYYGGRWGGGWGALAGGVVGAVTGLLGTALVESWRRGYNARAVAAAAPVGGATLVGQYANRQLAPADISLYRHAIRAFGGDKNIVNLATADNVDVQRLGIRYSKAAVDYVFANQAAGAGIHFHLDGLVINAPSVAGGTVDFSPAYKGSAVASGGGGLVRDTVTAHELRYLARRFHRNAAAGIANPPVTFYLNGAVHAGVTLPLHTTFGSAP